MPGIDAFLTDSVLWHNLNLEPGRWVLRGIGAAIVVVVVLILGRVAAARVRHSLLRARLGPNAAVLLARATRLAVWSAGAIWILALFQVPFTALAAVVSVTALAVSLSLQDVLKNLIAGVYLLAERPFHIGDQITVAGVTGVIDDIQMRVTYLHNDLGERIVMPNQTVFTQVIVNNSISGRHGSMLSIETRRSIRPAEIKDRVNQALVDSGVVEAQPPPVLEPVSLSPECTSWTLTFRLKMQNSLGDAITALGDALPEASIGPAASGS